jgi:4-hydroxybenzoate polyprenyltransferase
MKQTVLVISGLVAAYGLYKTLAVKKEDKPSAKKQVFDRGMILAGGIGLGYGLFFMGK